MSAGTAPSGGPKPKLVMVPGLDGTALLFYRQVPLLSEDFDVVTFPLPDDPEATMDRLVASLHALLDATSEAPVILCGESFGGALSMSFALAHPDRVRGLVIVNSFPYVRSRLQLRLAPLALRLFPWAAMPLVRRFTEARMHSPHTLPEDLREFHERSKQIGRLGYIRRLEILQRYDLRDRLHEIAAPTLLIAGDRDHLVPSVEEAHFMADRIPRAKVQVLTGYGHICLINHDLNLLEYVRPWCEDVGFGARGAVRASPA